MNITIIVGSQRTVSNSAKVGRIVEQILNQKYSAQESLNSVLNIKTIDLGSNPLPLWNQKVWEQDKTWTDTLTPYREILDKSDALVIVTPEYNGMASPALKNFFLFWNGEILAHKPALLISVTQTEHNGAYPIAELRASSYKNTRLVYIPDHVIVRDCESFGPKLEDIQKNTKDEAQLRTLSRLEYGLYTLVNYSKAMSELRKNTDFNYKDFGNGI